MIIGLLACAGDDPQAKALTDTGWFTPGTGATADCPDRILTTNPATESVDWSWLAAPRVYTTTAATGVYDAWVVDERLISVPITLQWDPGGALHFDVVPEAPWLANADHTLTVVDCVGPTDVTFRTADFGLPIEGGVETLVGRTWVVNLADGTWVQPASFGALLSLYVTTPVLLGVEDANSSFVDLLAGPGIVDPLVGLVQDPGADTWDFAPAAFDDAPYFQALSPHADLAFEGSVIPIDDFEVSGTFAADGASIGGLRVKGLGDTRSLGVVFGSDDPGAACAFTEDLGVPCEVCSDGLPYCLQIDIVDAPAEELPGLTLVPQ